MLRATFAGFSVARGAMTASQKALDVTGQNISNVYTTGYTRQRLDQVSFASGYGNYAVTNYTTHIGNGVLVTGTSQIRDPYLDIQYRTQMANVGMSDAKASALEELESVFDETMKSAIKDAFSDLESKLLDLANSTGAELDDSIVRSSMQSLVNLFHSNATRLAEKRENVTKDFENSVKQVNELMEKIAEYNKTIKSSHILGHPALELQDKRNDLLDELASYVPIQVNYRDEYLNAAKTEKVDVLEVYMIQADGTKVKLIDHDQTGEFEAETDNDEKFTALELRHLGNPNDNPPTPAGTTPISEIAGTNGDERRLYINGGTFAGTLNMLNSSGVFDGDATTEKGFGYYEKAFDLLVDTFAQKLNELNKKSEDVNGNPVGDGGPLFVTSDVPPSSTGPFTAANIKVNDDWIKGAVKLKAKIDPDSGTTQNDNINKFIAALNDKQEFEITDASNNQHTIFNGNFYNYYVDIESTLGIDQQATDNLLDNHITVLNTIAQSKDEVSGVSLDEEGISLMQYQQSYTAAARLMTTLDDTLQTLLNIAGR